MGLKVREFSPDPGSNGSRSPKDQEGVRKDV